jgi:hypothetical protein
MGSLLCPPGCREVAEIDVILIFLCEFEYDFLYNKMYYKSSQCAHRAHIVAHATHALT